VARIGKLVGSAIDAPRRSRHKATEDLAAAVRRALESVSPAAAGFSVREARGVVTLRGEVDQMDDIERYEAAARAVPGVSDVDNLLRLTLTGSPHPRVLTA
jgi:osmotically-inducible protein OsmY